MGFLHGLSFGLYVRWCVDVQRAAACRSDSFGCSCLVVGERGEGLDTQWCGGLCARAEAVGRRVAAPPAGKACHRAHSSSRKLGWKEGCARRDAKRL